MGDSMYWQAGLASEQMIPMQIRGYPIRNGTQGIVDQATPHWNQMCP